MLPGIPRIVRLSFSGHQTPSNGGDSVFPGDGQSTLERAAVATRHVFGAQDWPVVLLQPQHAFFKFVRFVIAVEGNHIGQFELDFLHGAELFPRIPFALPDTPGQGLRGVHRAGPFERAREQFEDNSRLEFRLHVAATPAVRIVRLGPYLPSPDAVVASESAYNTFYI